MNDGLKTVLWIVAFFALLFGIYKYTEWQDSQPKPRSMAYVCPADDSTTKCYEVPVDYEKECDNDDEHTYCWSLVSTVYWPNGGYTSMDYCDDAGKKMDCWDEEGNNWTVQLTGEKTKERYYKDGTLATPEN